MNPMQLWLQPEKITYNLLHPKSKNRNKKYTKRKKKGAKKRR